jgi:hypothetical protein
MAAAVVVVKSVTDQTGTMRSSKLSSRGLQNRREAAVVEPDRFNGLVSHRYSDVSMRGTPNRRESNEAKRAISVGPGKPASAEDTVLFSQDFKTRSSTL